MTALIQPASWTHQLKIESCFTTLRPLEIDLGCGKGRFLIAHARKHPEINHIGVDRLLTRLSKIDRKITSTSLENVRLLRIENSYAVEHLLPHGSVSTFYIFFPDPWPKKKHHKRRMLTSGFIRSLHNRLAENGKVHIATDHMDYFREIQGLFETYPGFTETEIFVPPEDERTNFEKTFLEQGIPIGRCSYEKS